MNRADPPGLELVISPFEADAGEMVEVARCAEDSGYDAVWTFDHLTGSMLDRGWSHDPFAVLGAMAIVTDRIRLGPLVANMMNRHPVQLGLAMASLQSLSQGRAVLGLGAGASPGSMWAGEHEAIGTALLASGTQRQLRLVETIQVIEALWSDDESFHGRFFTVDPIDDVVGPSPRPPIILGGSGPTLTSIALAWADGVNLLPGPGLDGVFELLAAADPGPDFAISLYDRADLDHPRGGEPDPASRAHPGLVTARTLAVQAPFDLAAIARLGRRHRAGQGEGPAGG